MNIKCNNAGRKLGAWHVITNDLFTIITTLYKYKKILDTFEQKMTELLLFLGISDHRILNQLI